MPFLVMCLLGRGLWGSTRLSLQGRKVESCAQDLGAAT